MYRYGEQIRKISWNYSNCSFWFESACDTSFYLASFTRKVHPPNLYAHLLSFPLPTSILPLLAIEIDFSFLFHSTQSCLTSVFLSYFYSKNTFSLSNFLYVTIWKCKHNLALQACSSIGNCGAFEWGMCEDDSLIDDRYDLKDKQTYAIHSIFTPCWSAVKISYFYA